MSDGYTPFVRPIEDRAEFVRTATYNELREGLMWAVEAKKAADEEYHIFAVRLRELLHPKTKGDSE